MPPTSDSNTPPAAPSVEVHLVLSNGDARTAHVAAGTTLLEAARSVGLPVASACGADGVCARCGMRILEGESAIERETPREAEIKRRNRVDAELRLACRVRVDGALTATAPYW